MNPFATPLRKHETKVYLAARFDRQEELRDYARILKDQWIEVTSRWLWMPAAYVADTSEFKDICAVIDIQDIGRADVVVSFTADPKRTSRGGRHVEFGIGLALKKRMIIIGEREHIFHFMYAVEVFPDFNTLITKILGQGD